MNPTITEGQIVRLPSNGSFHGELFRVVREKEYGVFMWWLSPLPHVNSHGKVIEEDEDTALVWDDDWDDEHGPAAIAALVIPMGEVALVLATRHSDKHGTYHKVKKNAVRHKAHNSEPVCGAAATRVVDFEAGRYDPWNRQVCDARTETSVWLPATGAVTCKRCEKAR